MIISFLLIGIAPNIPVRHSFATGGIFQSQSGSNGTGSGSGCCKVWLNFTNPLSSANDMIVVSIGEATLLGYDAISVYTGNTEVAHFNPNDSPSDFGYQNANYVDFLPTTCYAIMTSDYCTRIIWFTMGAINTYHILVTWNNCACGSAGGAVAYETNILWTGSNSSYPLLTDSYGYTTTQNSTSVASFNPPTANDNVVINDAFAWTYGCSTGSASIGYPFSLGGQAFDIFVSGYANNLANGITAPVTFQNSCSGGLTIFDMAVAFSQGVNTVSLNVAYYLNSIGTPYPPAPTFTYYDGSVQTNATLSYWPSYTTVQITAGSTWKVDQYLVDSSGRHWFPNATSGIALSVSGNNLIIGYGYNDQSNTVTAIVNQIGAYVRWLIPSLLIIFCFLLIGSKANRGQPVSIPMLLLLETFAFAIVGILGWFLIGVFIPVWLAMIGIIFCIVGMFFTKEGVSNR